MKYLSPIGEVDALDVGLAPRLGGLDGKVLGLLDNDMPNSCVILQTIVRRLQERYQLAGIVERHRFQTGPGQAGEELADSCDFVIAANGM
ncbi:MAG: hypothetical protein HYX92_18265 [Chloroflexi bacterium]|nr:hypothetical protein [Chloroflexota bacterium]